MIFLSVLFISYIQGSFSHFLYSIQVASVKKISHLLSHLYLYTKKIFSDLLVGA